MPITINGAHAESIGTGIELTHIRKFILASSCLLWYHLGWFHESGQLCVGPCKYTTTEFSVKTRLDGTQGWDV